MSNEADRQKARQTILASGLFDGEFYRSTYPDMRSAGADPLTHYLTVGEAEGRSPNAVFLPHYYTRHAVTHVPVEGNALAHYAEHGARLGAKPHPAFDPAAYLAANPQLTDYADRLLLHFLMIGREAGLLVAPEPRGEALTRVLRAQRHATEFAASGQRNHAALMRYKQALARYCSVDEAFALYRQTVDLPDSDSIRRRPLAGLGDVAGKRAATFHEIAPAGEIFVMPPPRVIGEGAAEECAGVTRAIFVACLLDARVRARSGFIEMDDMALLDLEGGEWVCIGDQIEFDPAVFYAADGMVWIIGPGDNDLITIELDEAFSLLGSHGDDFPHWILDMLPRYVAASASGTLPPVPVLIDARLPAEHRQSLELMLPKGVKIIELPSFAQARVHRLWCASSVASLPVFTGRRGAATWDYAGVPPQRLALLVADMTQRAADVVMEPTGDNRVYLAGRAGTGRSPYNSAELEAAAGARGFVSIHPDTLSFAANLRLIHHADFMIAQDRSALPLAWFARPGTKLCCLSDPCTAQLVPLTAGLERLGIDVCLLTGPVVDGSEPGSGAPYYIDPMIYGDFLDGWLPDSPATATAPRSRPHPVKPNRSLATAADRQRVFEGVEHGVAVVNRLFGTAIPFAPAPGFSDSLRPDALADPDHYYARMMAALFGRNFAGVEDFAGFYACYRGLTTIDGMCDGWTINALRYQGLAEPQLIKAAKRRLTLHSIDVFDGFSRQNFLSLKLNHSYWGYLAQLGLAAPRPAFGGAAGLPVNRDYDRSLFDALMVLAIRRLETDPGSFTGPGHALGFGISNGDTSFEADLQEPLHPACREAIEGLLAFFDGYAPEATVRASDGAAVKDAFWNGRLDRLARLAAEATDRVVFIVPTHLAGIGLNFPAPAQETILVPAIHLYELWPTAMAGLAGQLTEILDRHRRVAVFMQAGAMSIPIGTLIHLMLRDRPDNSLYCFDMGQILDVAVYPSRSAGHWICKADVAAAIAGQPLPFVIDV